MTRFEIFSKLVEVVTDLSKEIYMDDLKPRSYGTEEKLFMAEAHYIDLIGDCGKTNVTQLTELTQKTKGAVSQMVGKLVKKGLVSKKKSDQNYREIIIELTPKGEIIYNFHKEFDKNLYNSYLVKLDDYTDEDLQMIVEFMTIIADTHKLKKNEYLKI